MNALRGEILRFGIVGVINSLFGYFLGVGLFLLLSPFTTSILISVLATSIAIVFSFTTQKFFVFRVKGDWLRQFAKGVAVYAVITVVGAALFAQLIDVFHVTVWIAQAAVIAATAVFGFIGSKLFTFRVSSAGQADPEAPPPH